MSHTLTILGCGYIGTALANSALENEWTVSALTRNEETGKKLEDLGVQNVVVSRLDSDEWHSYLDSKQDFVVNCVGAFSPSLDGYVTSYIEGQKSAMKWLENGVVNSYVFTSSCSVYPQTGRKLVDEKGSCAGVSEKGDCFWPRREYHFHHLIRFIGVSFSGWGDLWSRAAFASQ